MLTAQVLCTNGFYKQVQSERKMNQNKSININEVEDSIIILEKMVAAINKEIEELKKN